MFSIRKTMTALILVAVGTLFAQGVPHYMWGHILNQGGSIPSSECITFKCYIQGQPASYDTIRYPGDPRTTYNPVDGTWTVQIAGLDPRTGDVFVIVVANTCSLYTNRVTAAVDMTVSAQEISPVALDISETRASLPKTFGAEVYPSPFNSACKIFVRSQGPTNVTIYNMIGKPVDVLFQGEINGEREFYWAPKNILGGVYFAKIVSKENTITKKLVYLP